MKPEHLEIIRLSTLTMARAIRANGKEVAPMLMLFSTSPTGKLRIEAAGPLLECSSIDMARVQQKAARMPDVDAALLINEGWQTFVSPGEPVPTTTEGRPDRQEMLLLNLLTKSAQWILCAEIHGKNVDDAQFVQASAETFTGAMIRETAP